MYISRRRLDLWKRRNHQMKGHSIFFRIAYGFIFYGHPRQRNDRNGLTKKLTPQKNVQYQLRRWECCIYFKTYFLVSFFLCGHFDHFYGAEGHKTIHHSKGNLSNFNFVAFELFYL